MAAILIMARVKWQTQTTCLFSCALCCSLASALSLETTRCPGSFPKALELQEDSGCSPSLPRRLGLWLCSAAAILHWVRARHFCRSSCQIWFPALVRQARRSAVSSTANTPCGKMHPKSLLLSLHFFCNFYNSGKNNAIWAYAFKMTETILAILNFVILAILNFVSTNMLVLNLKCSWLQFHQIAVHIEIIEYAQLQLLF